MSTPTSYTFAVALIGHEEIVPEVERKFYQANLDDALLYARDGLTYVRFERQAATLDAAQESALEDLATAGLLAMNSRDDGASEHTQEALLGDARVLRTANFWTAPYG